MGTLIKRIIQLSALILFFGACDIFEFRGFVMPYETVNQRFEQSMAWNAEHSYTNISVAQDRYELFVMGDTHVGDTVNLNIFLGAAVDAGAAGAVMAGDITTGNDADFYIFARQLPPESILPTFPIVGNHDLYFHGWEQYYELFGTSTYLFTVQTPNDSDLYICLDNAAATLGSKQIAWLKEILETRRPQYRNCIIFTHTNFFRIRRMTATNPYVEELQMLTELCLRHDVDMVISGHDHERNTGTLGNTEFLILDVLRDGEKNAGYLILNIESDTISYEFVDL
ncbi:MAG: metallophosphoesterase [Candidatus Marinimicrobia bacterium]|jgi:predicted phosphodiesterase|nr:metallophosphoesterase [Candidatus Neomarinimicrobiota bacterium]MDD4961584.1 metallophosphoesterase [Candidatus Neomarinimicrobiota bacterium]MDD5710249.1 metallophosphoesterase [Candidatus Neomarinimicrobiota bacterium]MDX9777839.1 metallophosphoesterase [bacterium]